MPNHVVRRIRGLVAGPEHERKIALLGASYKANVDDSRESPTQKIDELLREHGYSTAIYDPIASGFTRPLSPSLAAALDGADALVLVVDHDAFKSIAPSDASKHMRGRIVVDARNMFPADKWLEAGFSVYTLGRRSAIRDKRTPNGASAKGVAIRKK
jgi:UDP-N-acetyl-D-mannosaminuronic acid dehydrogenase